jgi:hypothetical protein
VGKVRKRDHTIGSRNAGGALQRADTGIAGSGYGGAVVRRTVSRIPKVPELVFDLNHRLLTEDGASNGGGRGLSLDGQIVSGT